MNFINKLTINFSINFKSIKPFKKLIHKILSLKVLESFLEVVGIGMLLPLLNIFFNDEKYLFYNNFFLKYNIDLSRDYLIVFIFLFIFLISVFKFFIFFINNKMQHFFFNEYRISLVKKILNHFFKKINTRGYENDKRNVINLSLVESEKASFYFKFYWQMISTIIVTVGIIIFLFFVSLEITISLIVLYFIVYVLFSKKIKKFSETSGNKRVVLNKNISGKINKILDLFQVIFLEDIYSKNKKKLFNQLDLFSKTLTSFGAYSNIFRYLTEPVFLLLLLLLIFTSVFFFNVDLKIHIPIIAIFLISFNRISNQMSKVVNCYMNLKLYIKSIKNIENYLGKDFSHKNSYDINSGYRVESFKKIKVKNLKVVINKNYLFKDLNFEIKTNKINFLIGGSGSGKSTLLDIIAGLTKPNRGNVLINNHSLYNEINLKEFRKRVSYIYQNCAIFEDNIINNIFLSPNYEKDKFSNLRLLKLAKILKLKNLLLKNKKTQFLSGGEKQRVLLLRALMKKSKIIILDETLSGINEDIVIKFLNYFRKENKNQTLILTTHNFSIINYKKDNIINI